MNEFEKACNTENYTGETIQENVIEWIKGDKEVTVTLCGNTKYASKVKKLAEQYPDEVKIMHVNNDGSIVSHLPLSYIKISHPKKLTVMHVNNDGSIVSHLPLSYIKISHPKKVTEKQIEVAKENMIKLLNRNGL